MTLEDRIARLESRIETIDAARTQMRNQLIALQISLVSLVPVISIVPEDDVRQSMRAACAVAESTLLAARYPEDDIQAVVREVQTLHGEILDASASAYPMFGSC